MSGILVRIMVGMLVGIMVGMYASNVDHTGTDTALRSTVPVPVPVEQHTVVCFRFNLWVVYYGICELFIISQFH